MEHCASQRCRSGSGDGVIPEAGQRPSSRGGGIHVDLANQRTRGEAQRRHGTMDGWVTQSPMAGTDMRGDARWWVGGAVWARGRHLAEIKEKTEQRSRGTRRWMNETTNPRRKGGAGSRQKTMDEWCQSNLYSKYINTR